MKSSYMQLEKILDLKKWQLLQDSLSVATNLAILTVDYRGTPITKHSGLTRFCESVRNNESCERFCRKCDSRGGLEAARMNRPHIYLCHCGVIDIAIPIIVGDKYIGAVMAGQVRLAKEESAAPEIIFSSPAENIANNKQHLSMLDELPIMTYDRIQMLAQMLYDLCHYIVSEAINRNLILEVLDYLKPQQQEYLSLDTLEAGSLQQIKNILTNAVTEIQPNQPNQSSFRCKNHILQPAFDYITNDLSSPKVQTVAAKLCHVSPGYFSRQFSKETGMNFTEFVMHQKIDHAKKLLLQTDLSISEISDQLGFSESGYFIRTFKKYESITPLAFRKYFSDELFPK